jgi:FdhD protein
MRVLRWDGRTAAEVDDELAIEEPLEIRVRGRAVSVTMRTPGHDEDLAAGFLLTEGVIGAGADVLRFEHCGRNEHGNVLNVTLAPHVRVDFDRLTRHVFASSSCGVCGKATIDSVKSQFPPVTPKLTIDAPIITSLPDIMRAAQSAFDRTGGIHAAAIFDADGTLIVAREDVGRHNAVDKAIGYCLGRGVRGGDGRFPLDRHVLLVSGRSSFEILQKALAARIPIVASVSAPSSLAAEFASESGQTLIGFLRDSRMNVYTHPERVRLITPVERTPSRGNSAPTLS